MSDTTAWVVQLHDLVDGLALDLARQHEARLHCGLGCTACCVDDLTVLAIEADLIRTRQGAVLEEEPPHPPGACAFLDPAGTGACRIYADRPYVCRTQGLPLRWVEQAGCGAVERRDICPENEAGEFALEDLQAAACWPVGPFEDRMAAMNERAGGDLRESLRGLFAARPGHQAAHPRRPTGADHPTGGRPRRHLLRR